MRKVLEGVHMGALPEVKEICIQFKSAFSYVNPKLVQKLSPFSKTLLTEIHCFYSWNLRCCSQRHEVTTNRRSNEGGLQFCSAIPIFSFRRNVVVVDVVVVFLMPVLLCILLCKMTDNKTI